MIYFVSHLESGSKLATRNSEEPLQFFLKIYIIFE